MMGALGPNRELRMLGEATFLLSFTADDCDVYHVADFMRPSGWRFNGQQYPNALHMAVTRPQTQPGVVDAFTSDLAEAVAYARAHADEPPVSAAIYGGVPGGMTLEAEEFMRATMAQLLDAMQGVPA